MNPQDKEINVKYFDSHISRRKFLKWQIQGSIITLAGIGLGRPLSVFGSSYPDIGIVKGDPGPATRAAVELLGGMSAFVKPGQKVLIKPNMSFDQPPEMATTTHPDVIQALALMCREAGASHVFVLDNPLRSSELCLEKSGIKALENKIEQCEIKTYKNSNRFKNIKIEQGKQLTSTEVMTEVLNSDVLIAAPVAKHHSSTGVSLSMKGMLGLIQNRSVLHWRYDLHTAIVDLCTLLKPDLSVIDVSRALTTNGPSGPGKVDNLKRIVASRDMVAADAKVVSMVKWYGRSFSPSQIKHIRIAHERGLGRMDVENLQVKQMHL